MATTAIENLIIKEAKMFLEYYNFEKTAKLDNLIAKEIQPRILATTGRKVTLQLIKKIIKSVRGKLDDLKLEVEDKMLLDKNEINEHEIEEQIFELESKYALDTAELKKAVVKNLFFEHYDEYTLTEIEEIVAGFYESYHDSELISVAEKAIEFYRFRFDTNSLKEMVALLHKRVKDLDSRFTIDVCEKTIHDMIPKFFEMRDEVRKKAGLPKFATITDEELQRRFGSAAEKIAWAEGFHVPGSDVRREIMTEELFFDYSDRNYTVQEIERRLKDFFTGDDKDTYDAIHKKFLMVFDALDDSLLYSNAEMVVEYYHFATLALDDMADLLHEMMEKIHRRYTLAVCRKTINDLVPEFDNIQEKVRRKSLMVKPRIPDEELQRWYDNSKAKERELASGAEFVFSMGKDMFFHYFNYGYTYYEILTRCIRFMTDMGELSVDESKALLELHEPCPIDDTVMTTAEKVVEFYRFATDANSLNKMAKLLHEREKNVSIDVCRKTIHDLVPQFDKIREKVRLKELVPKPEIPYNELLRWVANFEAKYSDAPPRSKPNHRAMENLMAEDFFFAYPDYTYLEIRKRCVVEFELDRGMLFWFAKGAIEVYGCRTDARSLAEMANLLHELAQPVDPRRCTIEYCRRRIGDLVCKFEEIKEWVREKMAEPKPTLPDNDLWNAYDEFKDIGSSKKELIETMSKKLFFTKNNHWNYAFDEVKAICSEFLAKFDRPSSSSTTKRTKTWSSDFTSPLMSDPLIASLDPETRNQLIWAAKMCMEYYNFDVTAYPKMVNTMLTRLKTVDKETCTRTLDYIADKSKEMRKEIDKKFENEKKAIPDEELRARLETLEINNEFATRDGLREMLMKELFFDHGKTYTFQEIQERCLGYFDGIGEFFADDERAALSSSYSRPKRRKLK